MGTSGPGSPQAHLPRHVGSWRCAHLCCEQRIHQGAPRAFAPHVYRAARRVATRSQGGKPARGMHDKGPASVGALSRTAGADQVWAACRRVHAARRHTPVKEALVMNMRTESPQRQQMNGARERGFVAGATEARPGIMT